VIATVAMFGLLTLACAFTNSYAELMICRFLAGVGLGGAVVNFFTLIAEYSPSRLRVHCRDHQSGHPSRRRRRRAFAGYMIENSVSGRYFTLAGYFLFLSSDIDRIAAGVGQVPCL